MKTKRRSAPPRGQIDIYAKRSRNGHRPGVYLITFRKCCSLLDFGSLGGNAAIPPGQPGGCFIEFSQAGVIIERCISEWMEKSTSIRICAHAVMPDHMHLLVVFNQWQKYDFSNFTDALKLQIERELRPLLIREERIFSPRTEEKYFGDMVDRGPFESYIRSNPHRLGMKLRHPEFFDNVRKISIDGREFMAKGNLFLLRNPDKLSFHIDDQWSDWKKKQARIIYQSQLETGGILVSPFLSVAELALLIEYENSGGKFIAIIPGLTEEPNGERKETSKLSEKWRRLLASRQFLLLSPLTSKTEENASYSPESLYGMADKISALP